jgi:hypothetical protein
MLLLIQVQRLRSDLVFAIKNLHLATLSGITILANLCLLNVILIQLDSRWLTIVIAINQEFADVPTGSLVALVHEVGLFHVVHLSLSNFNRCEVGLRAILVLD